MTALGILQSVGVRAQVIRPPSGGRSRPDLDRTLLAVGGLTLAATVLRFSTLDLQSFWYDEAFTAVATVRPSLFDTLGLLGKTDMLPPLYPTLAWVWTHLFGTSEVGFRSLSAVAGAATVPVLYHATAKLVSPRAGLVAAALATVHPLLVWYSQDARPYAVLLLASSLTLLTFGTALREPSPRHLAVWAVTCVLAVWTHHFAVYIVGAEASWLLASVPPQARRRVVAACASVVLAGAVFLPLALTQRATRQGEWISALPFNWRMADIVEKYVAGWPQPEVDNSLSFLLVVPLGLLAIWLLATRANRPERSGGLAFLVLGSLAVLIPFVLALAGVDYFHQRHLVAALPALLAAFAAGFGARAAGVFGIVAATALCAVSIAFNVRFLTDPSLQRTNWRSAVHALGPPTGGRAIVLSPGWAAEAVKYYAHAVAPLSTRGARVREIVVLAQRGYPPPRAIAPAPQYQRVERRSFEQLSLTRYRARAPSKVTPMELTRRLRVSPYAALMEPPNSRD